MEYTVKIIEVFRDKDGTDLAVRFILKTRGGDSPKLYEIQIFKIPKKNVQD